MNSSVKSVTCALFLAIITLAGCTGQQTLRKDESLTPGGPAATSGSAKAQAPVSQPGAVTAAEKAPPAAPKAEVPPAAGPAEAAAAKASAPSGADLQRGLEKIYFDFDSPTLTDASRRTLTENAELLARNSQLKVRVDGHCDERGSDDYNLALGQKRADAAVRYLTTLGIGAERLSSLSYGKEKPAVAGHDEAAWSKNRRDEFVVLK